MLRLRRYRAFLIFAIIAIGALYHFTSLGTIENAGAGSVEGLKNFGGYKGESESPAPAEPDKEPDEDLEDIKEAGQPAYKEALSITADDPAVTSTTLAVTSSNALEEPEATPTASKSTIEGSGNDKTTVEEDNSSPLDDGSSTAPDVAPVAAHPNMNSQDGQGRLEMVADESMPLIYWEKQTEHFPLPSKSIIQLPTGKPRDIPKIQYDFPDESATEKIDREKKLDIIKKTFKFSWFGYKHNAWMHDELSPVTGQFRDPFCGWAATLVDSLDTLWMMGLKSEFEEATKAVGNIDFTTSIRNDIPLFETVIRYLGGLIAAYDLGGSKYKILLDKAVELAEILIGAFDTPNRMPMTFYLWKPTFASQPHRANTRVVLAELGSLSVEFTRLAQITKEPKYYDAVARISIEFERWQNHTKMPGLWPQKVDASGCKKEEISPISPFEHSLQKGPGALTPLPQGGQIVEGDTYTSSSTPDNSSAVVAGQAKTSTVSGLDEDHDSIEAVATKTEIAKRQLTDDEIAATSPSAKPDCEPQGLASPPYASIETFTLGGQADSVYEYLPKEYMLLGGLEPQYQTMYEMAVEATSKYLLFRPMIPDEKRDILFSGQVSTSGHLDEESDTQIKAEGTHLTCFVGGMFAIGAKIFDRKEDLKIASKLADGCVWAYESTNSGIMPEHFLALPCASREQCPWNETAYWEALDPFASTRVPSIPATQTVLEEKSASDDQDSSPIGGSSATNFTEDEEEKVPSAAKGNVSDEADELESTKSINKRQLGDSDDSDPAKLKTETNPHKSTGTTSAASKESADVDSNEEESTAVTDGQTSSKDTESATGTKPEVPDYTPPPVPTQEEYAKTKIRDERLPPGVVSVTGSKYILRPEAIESVFIMWRITGDVYWREKGWKMFEAIQNATATEYGASAIMDVTSKTSDKTNEMESFWLAETLKYFYLLFSDPGWISLDDYVLNTEAHAFKRPK